MIKIALHLLHLIFNAVDFQITQRTDPHRREENVRQRKHENKDASYFRAT